MMDQQRCPDCEGSGIATRYVGELDQNCPACSGNGLVWCIQCTEKDERIAELEELLKHAKHCMGCTGIEYPLSCCSDCESRNHRKELGYT